MFNTLVTCLPHRSRPVVVRVCESFKAGIAAKCSSSVAVPLSTLAIGFFACTFTTSVATPFAGTEVDSTGADMELLELKDPPGDRLSIMVLDNSCGIPDPAIDASYASRSILNLPLVTEIHAGLVEVAPMDDTVEPYLAETFTQSNDATAFEFRLRKGLRFSDGSELTTSDVKWSWERALSLSTSGSQSRATFGSVRGAEQFLAGESGELEGIRTIDDRTLSVSFDSPSPRFPMMLATPGAAVLKRENVESWPVRWTNESTIAGINATFDEDHADQHLYEDFDETNLPVGAGPFKLAKYEYYDIGATCHFVRNEHYWGSPAKLDAVKFGVNLDAYPLDELELAADPGDLFLNGRIDLQLVLSNDALRDSYARLVDLTDGRRQSVDSPPYTLFLAFDTSIPPFDDLHFRRALIHSTNLGEVFNVPVRWQRRIVPPRLTNRASRIEPLPANDELGALELVRSPISDQIGAYSFVMYADGSTGHVERLERLFEQWDDKLGLHIQIQLVESLDSVQEQIESGSFPITMFELQPISPDPLAVLGVFDAILSDAVTQDSVGRIVRGKLREASAELDPSKRRQLTDDLEQSINDQALAVPLLVDWIDLEMLVQPWVHDFNLKRFGGSVFHDVWFDDTAPERALP